MSKHFAGLTGIAYGDTATGAWTSLTGKISADSTIEPTNIETETTNGVIYGGSQIAGNVRMLSYADYNALQLFMLSDTEKFWRFTYQDGRTKITSSMFNIMVRPEGGVNARDGVVAYVINFSRVSNAPILTGT